MLIFKKSTFIFFLTVALLHLALSSSFQKLAIHKRQPRDVVQRPRQFNPFRLKADIAVSNHEAANNNPNRITQKIKTNAAGKLLEKQNVKRERLALIAGGTFLVTTLLVVLNTFQGFPSMLDSTSVFADRMLQDYQKAMLENPLRTKILTGATLSVVGDFFAQMRESNQYDSYRAVSFAAFDSCYRTFQHHAFPTIVGVAKGRMLGSILSVLPFVTLGANAKLFLAALERTLMYQFVVIPFFYYPVFFTFTGFLQGLSVKATIQRAKENFLPCWKRNLMFWIPIQLVMFGLVDEKWQIPFVCVMGLIWSTILSVTAGQAKSQPSGETNE